MVRPNEGFPLKPGAYWIYQGPVKWTDMTKPGSIAERTLTWKMEVMQSMTVGQYEVAVMKGHPSDLAWFEEGKARSDYLIVRDGTKYYRLRSSEVPEPAKMESQLNFDSIFLIVPPPKGCLARDPEIKRDDEMYCWASDGTSMPVKLGGVKGIAPSTEFAGFELAMSTNPESQSVAFASGIGITAYTYRHHGTVSEVDVKLVEFHP